MTKRAARLWLIGLGGVIVTAVVAVVWARMALAPPPLHDGAVVGRVYTQQDDESWLFRLFPHVVREGVVFAVPSEQLGSFWAANGHEGDPPSEGDLREAVFVVSTESIRQALGDVDAVDDGSFELEVLAGSHLVCYSDSPKFLCCLTSSSTRET